MNRLRICGLVYLMLSLAEPASWGADYQKLADQAVWTWNDDAANLLYSVDGSLRDYQVDILCPRDLHNRWMTIRILADGKEVYRFRGHRDTVFTRSGDVLYLADFEPSTSGCAVVAYDLKTGKQLWRSKLKGIGPISHSRYRNRVLIDVDGEVLVIRGRETLGRYIEYVDMKTGKTVGHKKYPTDSPAVPATDTRGPGLTGATPKTGNARVEPGNSEGQAIPEEPREGHQKAPVSWEESIVLKAGFWAVAFAPDGTTLATGESGGLVRLWDMRTGNPAAALTMKDSAPVRYLAFSPDGKTLATSDGIVVHRSTVLWDVATKQPRFILPTWARSLAFSPDSKILATVSADLVILWDMSNGKEIGSLQSKGQAGTFHSVAFSPDGRTLATAEGAPYPTWGKIKLWDVATRKEQLTFSELQDHCVSAVAFSPDGKTLASTHFLIAGAQLWDVATGKQRVGLPSSVKFDRDAALAFSPDGRTLAAARQRWAGKRARNGLTLWDLATGKEMNLFNGPTDSVDCFAFSPDGRTLAAGGENTVTLWRAAVVEGSKKPIPKPTADAWSDPVKGLSGRLRISWLEKDASVRADATVEFKNVSSDGPLALSNTFQRTARVFNEAGKAVPGASIHTRAAAHAPEHWAVVPVDAYVGFPADHRCTGSEGPQWFTKGMEIPLTIGHERWNLGPGRYVVECKVVIADSQEAKGTVRHWVSEMQLPAVEIVIPTR